MFDICWVGGISTNRISAMAAANHLPVAPHDCVGPITLINGIHLSLSPKCNDSRNSKSF